MFPRFPLVLLLPLTLSSCGSLPQSIAGVMPLQPAPTAIADVQRNWQQYPTVTLGGNVGKHAPFLGSSAYQLEDSTGTIWVLTTHPLPPSHTTVRIKAKPTFTSIPLAGKEQGEVYVEELEREGDSGQSSVPSK